MVELEPEPEIWFPVPQTKFMGQASCTNNSVQWFLVFNGTNRSGAEAKKSRCLEQEHEIWVPAPQPCNGSGLADKHRYFAKTHWHAKTFAGSPRTGARGRPLPSARLISTTMQKSVSRPATSATHLVPLWGQFIVHDMASTPVVVVG